MEEIITRIEKLKPHPTEAITLFCNMDNMDVQTVDGIVKYLSEKFPENAIIALPDNVTLGGCRKDVLENIISMIAEIIESLEKQ
jgi:hypothetical protein